MILLLSLASCTPLRHMAQSDVQALEHRGVSVTIWSHQLPWRVP